MYFKSYQRDICCLSILTNFKFSEVVKNVLLYCNCPLHCSYNLHFTPQFFHPPIHPQTYFLLLHTFMSPPHYLSTSNKLEFLLLSKYFWLQSNKVEKSWNQKAGVRYSYLKHLLNITFIYFMSMLMFQFL